MEEHLRRLPFPNKHSLNYGGLFRNTGILYRIEKQEVHHSNFDNYRGKLRKVEKYGIGSDTFVHELVLR